MTQAVLGLFPGCPRQSAWSGGPHRRRCGGDLSQSHALRPATHAWVEPVRCPGRRSRCYWPNDGILAFSDCSPL